MAANAAANTRRRLILASRLEDLALVTPWVGALAAEYAIPAETEFAIHLCLEEAISNIVRHGYREQSKQLITVDFALSPTGGMEFRIEDHGPPFDPLDPSLIATAPTPASIEEIPLGGRGLRLMRKFAGNLAYERLADANRLTIGFPLRH